MMLSCPMLLVDRQALSEHTTTSSPTESLGQALRVSLVKPGAYLSESYMLNEPQSKGRTHENLLKARLRQEIEGGIAASRDPVNASLPELAARLTTIYSPWYTRTCPECKDKFRED